MTGVSLGSVLGTGRRTLSGSIDGLGVDLGPFRINDLELVDQNSASWNRTVGWLRQLDALETSLAR